MLLCTKNFRPWRLFSLLPSNAPPYSPLSVLSFFHFVKKSSRFPQLTSGKERLEMKFDIGFFHLSANGNVSSFSGGGGGWRRIFLALLVEGDAVLNKKVIIVKASAHVTKEKENQKR